MHSSFPKSHYSTGDALVLNNETACTEQTNKSDCHALTVNSVNKCVFRKKKCQILDVYSQTVVRELLEVCEQILKGPSNPIDLTQFTHLFEEGSPPTLVKDLPVPIPFDPFNVMGLRNDVVGKYCRGESFDGDDTWSNRVNEALYALGIHFIQQNKPVHGKAKKWKPVFRDCVLGLDESIPFYARVLFVKVASEQIVTVLAGEGDNKANRLSELLFEQYGVVTQIAKADEEQEEKSGTVRHIRSSRGIPNLMTLLFMILAVLNPASAQALDHNEMNQLLEAKENNMSFPLGSSSEHITNFATMIQSFNPNRLNKSTNLYNEIEHEMLNILIKAKNLPVKLSDNDIEKQLVYYLTEENRMHLKEYIAELRTWITNMAGQMCIQTCPDWGCIYSNINFTLKETELTNEMREMALASMNDHEKTPFTPESVKAWLLMVWLSELDDSIKRELFCLIKLAEEEAEEKAKEKDEEEDEEKAKDKAKEKDREAMVVVAFVDWFTKNRNTIAIQKILKPKGYTFIEVAVLGIFGITVAAAAGYMCYQKFKTKHQQVSSFLRYAIAQAAVLV